MDRLAGEKGESRINSRGRIPRLLTCRWIGDDSLVQVDCKTCFMCKQLVQYQRKVDAF